MGVFEINEIVALIAVALACAATMAARAHPANSARTRLWWTRFLFMLVLVLCAQIATNLEQLWQDDMLEHRVLNTLEHLLLCSAGAGAMVIGVRGIREAFLRLGSGEADGA
ncbi:MAG: hypothetical protein KBI47_12960 [Armatimonadetes bacterium]|nr:hypothetical protein [Armatimonadota bacterium]MDI9583686.1 hypothetical protein [Acidobacteriota bacterium]